MSDAELDVFEDAAGDIGVRVSEIIAEESEPSVEKTEDNIETLPMPDRFDDRVVDD